jgi:DNA mismatch endonuclease, patch repair protein
MADHISNARRSWNMSRIRSGNTRPELLVRSFLHRVGLRFRLHNRTLLGCPDLVFSQARTAVFVHGCFWHRHGGCRLATTPGTNTKFWQNKFRDNVDRDSRVMAQLENLGWNVEIVWECEISTFGRLEALALTVLALQNSTQRWSSGCSEEVLSRTLADFA